MPRIMNYYMDDSGTRTPNRKPLDFNPRQPDFFALGGVLIEDEQEAVVRQAYAAFRERWSITYPLNSVEIRHSAQRFSWLKRGTDTYDRFMRDLTRLLTSISVTGLACVIDRPGYDVRYRERYGRRQWHLCQTAFCIAVERAAKFALDRGCKLRVLPERSCRKDEQRIKRYFASLKERGAPFDYRSSSAYSPLGVQEYADTLYEIRFKYKTSPLTQIADLFLWPIAIGGYRDSYLPYDVLQAAGRLIEQRFPKDKWPENGTKYSCFDLVQSRK